MTRGTSNAFKKLHDSNVKSVRLSIVNPKLSGCKLAGGGLETAPASDRARQFAGAASCVQLDWRALDNVDLTELIRNASEKHRGR